MTVDTEFQKALDQAKKSASFRFRDAFNSQNQATETPDILPQQVDLLGQVSFGNSQFSAAAIQANNNVNVAIAKIQAQGQQTRNLLSQVTQDQRSQFGNMISIGNELGINESTRNVTAINDPSRVEAQKLGELNSQESLAITDVINQGGNQIVQLAGQDAQATNQLQAQRLQILGSLGITELDGQTLQTQQGLSNVTALDAAKFQLERSKVNAPMETKMNELNLLKTQAEIDSVTGKTNTAAFDAANGATVGDKMLSVPLRVKPGEDLITAYMRSAGTDYVEDTYLGTDDKTLQADQKGITKYSLLLGDYVNGKMKPESSQKFAVLKSKLEADFGKGFGVTHGADIDPTIEQNKDKTGNTTNLNTVKFRATMLEGAGMFPLNSEYHWDSAKANSKITWATDARPDQVLANSYRELLNSSSGEAGSLARKVGKLVFEVPSTDGKTADVYLAVANQNTDGGQNTTGFTYKKLEGLTQDMAQKLQIDLVQATKDSKDKGGLRLQEFIDQFAKREFGGSVDRFKDLGRSDFVSSIPGDGFKKDVVMTVLGVPDNIGKLPEAMKSLFLAPTTTDKTLSRSNMPILKPLGLSYDGGLAKLVTPSYGESTSTYGGRLYASMNNEKGVSTISTEATEFYKKLDNYKSVLGNESGFTLESLMKILIYSDVRSGNDSDKKRGSEALAGNVASKQRGEYYAMAKYMLGSGYQGAYSEDTLNKVLGI